MADWLSYSLADFILFSPETYDRLFGLANQALWPAHLGALAALAIIIALLWRGGAGAGRTIAALLAAAWLFVAVAWHLDRYATINWAAPWFAAGFAIQAGALLWAGLGGSRLQPRPQVDAVTAAGWLVLLLATVGYPLLAPLAGQPLTQAQVSAIAPDPTVAATLGVLLIVVRPPWPLFVLPVLWAAVSGATLWAMDSPQAPLLPGIAIASVTLAATARPARGARPADESTS